MLKEKIGNDVLNSCLVNYYENGLEYIGYQSDDERNIVKGVPI